MTEQTPINLVAAEQRLVEELTGETPAPQQRTPESPEPGDPVAPPEMDPAG